MKPPVGQRVRYEVSTRDGTSFAVPAIVVGHTARRVLIEYRHWRDGRVIRSAVREHRIASE